MRNSTHEALGATCAAGVGYAIGADPLVMVGLVVCSIPGSRLPDADQPGSRIHHLTTLERRLPIIRLVTTVWRAPIWLIEKLSGHREATHTAGACLVVPFAQSAVVGLPLLLPTSWGWVAVTCWAGLAIGYLVHVLGDGCTVDGVPFWAPVVMKKVHFLPRGVRLKTQRPMHPAEAAVALCACATLALTLYAWAGSVIPPSM